MADTNTRNITVQKVVVSVAAPYAEGHTLNAAEAKALNQMRAENIRNNAANAVKALQEAGYSGDELTTEAQSLVAKIDESYQFSLSGGGRGPADPFEKECISIAKAVLADKLAAVGRTVKSYTDDVGKDGIRDKLEQIAAMDAVQERARENIEQRARASAELTSDLNL